MRAVFVRSPGQLGDVTSTITDAAVSSMTPAIEQIMTEKVLPAMGAAIIIGAIAAAAVGTWFGTRAARIHGGIRRNPGRFAIVGRSRRRA